LLINGRESYVSGQFPPLGVGGKTATSEVAQWLGSQNFSPDLRNRYERFVSVWGNEPTTPADFSRIPSAVFEAFKLAPPQIKYEPATKIKAPQPTSTIGPISTQTPPPNDPQVKQYSVYKDALERWVRSETMLEQRVANAIRQAIASLMNQRIDWNAERLLKRDVKHNLFSLPNAAGEGNLDPDPIRVMDTTVDPDGVLRSELLALLRYASIFNETPSYEEADDDLARVANLIDRLQPSVITRVRASAKKQTKAAIALLSSNSRLLGLLDKGRTPSAVSSFLFSDVESALDLIDTAPQAFKDWRTMQRDALQIRPLLIDLVLETSGCFQGTGKKSHGVDIVGLIDDFTSEVLAPDLTELPTLSSELKTKISSMRAAVVNVRLKSVLDEAKTLEAKIANELGAEFDKQATIDVVKQVATDLRDMGVWPTGPLGFSSNEFLTLCDSFRNSAVKEALATLTDVHLDGFQSGDAVARTISRVAQMNLNPLLTAEKFISRSSQVIRAAKEHVQTMESKYESVTPSQTAEALVETFDNLAADLARLQ
jgi:hypothetical protein